ncbi:MAG: hypothetical protein NTV80_23230 [Verrucomicrobia bacterium]|nr:hypothetical protein [Verrucomicrobiota bacterium]
MSRLSQILVVAALVVSIGLHWAVLQSAAWVGMAVAYSVEKGSLTEGLSDTFDGDHPCPLCKAVKQGQDSESKSQNDQAPTNKTKEVKLTLALVTVPKFVFSPSAPQHWIMTSSDLKTRREEPVTPPPQRSTHI